MIINTSMKDENCRSWTKFLLKFFEKWILNTFHVFRNNLQSFLELVGAAHCINIFFHIVTGVNRLFKENQCRNIRKSEIAKQVARLNSYWVIGVCF